MHALWFLLFGLAVGAINAIVGGAAVVLFPLLVGIGVSPVIANATMKMIVMPGSISAAYGYRKSLATIPKRYWWLLVPSAVGALIGAIILVRTPPQMFERLAPVFLVIACVVLIAQPYIYRLIYHKRRRKKVPTAAVVAFVVAFLAIAIYSGYFGVGFGVFILAMLGLTRLSTMQQMNGLKNVCGAIIGGVDCTYFAMHHLIDWSILPWFIVGDVVGAYVSASYGARISPAKLRLAVIIVAVSMTAVVIVHPA
jgi:uncharacterized protein